MRFPVLDNSFVKTLKPQNYDGKNIAFLLESTQQELLSINDYYLKIPYLSLKMNKMKPSSYRALLKGLAQNNNASEFHNEVKKYQSDQEAIKTQKWREQQKKTFDNVEFWQRIINFAKTEADKSQIRRLQQQWFSQRLLHYPSAGLLEIAHKVLPVFEEYHELAKQEFNTFKKHLTSQQKIKISNYLSKLRKELTAEKHNLTEAMLARLTIASEAKDLCYDDVIVDYVKRISSFGVIRDIKGVPNSTSFALSIDNFQDFHNCIRLFGNPQQKERLDRLSWYKEDEQYKQLPGKANILIIPRHLEKYLTHSFWEFLFSNQPKRILTDNFALICHLRSVNYLRLPSCDIKNFRHECKWKYLEQLSTRLKEAVSQAQADKPKGILNQLFKRNSREFYCQWKMYLLKGYRDILTQKIAYAKRLAEQLNTRLTFELDQDILHTTHFKNDLESLIQQLEQDCEYLGVDVQDLPDWHEALIIFNQLKNSKPTYDKLSEAPLRTTENSSTALHCDHKNTIDIGNLKINDNVEQKNIFSPKSDIDLSPVIDIVIALSNLDNYIDQNTFCNIVEQLKIELDALEEHSLRELKKNVKAHMVQIFDKYLRSCISSNELVGLNSKRLVIVEQLLLQFSPAYIAKRVETLLQVKNESTFFLFQTKCRAILSSLEVQKYPSDMSIKQNQPLRKTDRAELSHLDNLYNWRM